MADILKGFAGGSFVFLLAWIFPSAVLVSLFAVLVMPIWVQLGVPQFTHGWDSTTTLVSIAFAGVFLGVLASTASTPLYRLLEGYSWPEQLQQWAVDRRRNERKALRDQYDRLKDTPGRRTNLIYERLSRYPIDDEELVPTRLGNAIRVMEVYGRDRFGLDSQTWWTELYSVAPAPIRQEVDNARAGVDFFVAAFYTTSAFAVLGIGTLLVQLFRSTDRSWALLAFGIAALVLPWAWYRVAVWGCDYWLSAVQAMVNVGRVPLAESLGVELPATLELERDLWQAATDFVNSPPFDKDLANALDSFRRRPNDQGVSLKQ